MSLKVENARGQCYDGAATMAGEKSGVAAKIKELNSKCLYLHCFGHALNLGVNDMMKNVADLKQTFAVVREVCKLVKHSPQRDTKLKKLRQETNNESKGVHAFCPTRWTIRGETASSMLDNHKELCDLWEWSLNNLKDTEMKARILGVKSYMHTFKFSFGCALAEDLLKQTDKLSKTLQNAAISASEGFALAEVVIAVIRQGRNNDTFETF